MSQKGIEIIHAKKYNPEELIKLCNLIDKISFRFLYPDTSDRITSLLFISAELIIFSKTFLSIKKFCPNPFEGLVSYFERISFIIFGEVKSIEIL